MTTFGPLFVPEPIREAVSDDAWFAAMLAAERALDPSIELDLRLDLDSLL